jgi:hypothetical protein
MKPTKNRYYCPASDRIKMLFESESKANNFMKFNAETIEKENGYKPVRAYYCVNCIGWHLTSIPLTKPNIDKSKIVQTKPTPKPILVNNQPIETNKRVLMPSSELFEKEPTIRISKICQDFNIGLEELFNLFKNHDIHINFNPKSKVNLIDFETIRYRLR